jgi:hypothetical protein
LGSGGLPSLDFLLNCISLLYAHKVLDCCLALHYCTHSK